MTTYANVGHILLKRGNTTQSSAYTGPLGELTLDTDLGTVRVHNGATAGGMILATNAQALATNANAAAQSVEISGLRANITAANVAIAGLTSNAAIQAAILDTLTGNAATQSTVLDSLTANAATQATVLTDLLSNAVSQQTSLIDLVANAATQAEAIMATSGSYTNANVATYLSAFDGNILPAANVTYSLGDATHQWKDLWVSNNTIYIGNTPIRVDGNTLLVNDAPVSGAGSTGDITFDATTISAPNEAVIAVEGKNSEGVVNSKLEINSEVAIAKLETFGTEIQNFYGGDGYWTTAVWTVTPFGRGQLEFTDAEQLYAFLDSSTNSWNSGENKQFSWNEGSPVQYSGYSYGGGTLTIDLGSELLPPEDPTEVTVLRLDWNNVSRVAVDQGDYGEIQIFGRDMPVEINSTEDVNIEAGDDLRLTGNDIVALRNNSPTEPVRIVTDDNAISKTWEFGANGELTTPGDITVAGDVTGTAGASTLILRAQPSSNTYIQLNNIVDSAFRAEANIALSTANNAYTWLFDNAGVLTFPDSTVQTTAWTGNIAGNILVDTSAIQFVASSSGDGLGYSTIHLIPDTSLEGTDQYLIVDPTGGEPGHIHLRAGGTQDSSAADLYLGGELTCVRVSDTSGIVTVRTTNVGDPNITLDWRFEQDGNLYFPGIGNNRIGENEPGLVVSSDNGVVLQSNNNGEGKDWTFGTDGNLTFPDSTIQTTAWTGTVNFGNTIAIGYNTGTVSQGLAAVAIGSQAGNIAQGSQAIAIGVVAGQSNQGTDAIAIGTLAGGFNQGEGAVAIGQSAGVIDQGLYAVAIGSGAGYQYQANNSIAITATGTQLSPTESGFYIDPVRNDSGNVSLALFYNTDTKEITYDTASTYGNTEVATYLANFDGAINFTASPAIISGLGNIDSAQVWAGNVTSVNGFFWANGVAYSTGGGGGNSFSTIAVAGQSNVVANSSASTMTLVAGSNITITTDSVADTVTISAAVGSGNVLEEPFESKSSATGVIEHDATTNRLFRHTSISANFTANFTNLGLTAGKATSISLVLVQGATARMCTAVQIGGAAQTITWQGSASAPLGNANRTDVVTFSILCTATDTYTVLGMLTSFGG